MTDKKPYALIAEFDSVSSIMHAAEKVRDEGYMIWDVHSPMPIHGINQAMGLRPTILPWITLAHGVAGAAFGLVLTWWMNATTMPGISASVQGYEFLVSGKPTFSLPANIPIIFETTILFAAIGTLLGMLGLNKLPMLHNPLNKSQRFLRATADRMFIVIEAEDMQFDAEKTRDFLQSLGPLAIEVVTED
ncbi:DUF3341 domain-containing protein [Novipirellula sp. SH528]|uniref:DUF3341 domain-containing protein n=1 Tax=Novipirellula sp. SH528 TaxID=3454466 RepID=UPI003FA00EBC